MAPETSLAARLQAAWRRRGPLACALWPISQIYRALWFLRGLAYHSGLKRSYRLPVPVVVVGNVVVGGAGKTPTVIEVVRHLQRGGWRPGVISRGYGRRHTGIQHLRPNSTSADVGDEPLLIAQATGVPVVVEAERVKAGHALLAAHPEVNVIVSDDGMQHWALQRDATVVVLDGRGVGNGWLLPAGMLREPWPARAWGSGPMLTLSTRPDALPVRPPVGVASTAFLAARALDDTATNALGDARPLASFAVQQPLGALAGIAQPAAFFDMLSAKGLRLTALCPMPDHADADALLRALQDSADHTVWLCTEKDAVKLFPALRRQASDGLASRCWAIPLTQQIDPGFFDAIDRALAAAKPLSSAHGPQTP